MLVRPGDGAGVAVTSLLRILDLRSEVVCLVQVGNRSKSKLSAPLRLRCVPVAAESPIKSYGMKTALGPYSISPLNALSAFREIAPGSAWMLPVDIVG
jgi:hypothetical protein